MTNIDALGLDLPEHDVPYVADRFRVSDSTVRRWIARGAIDHCKVGGLVRFSTSDIENFIRRSRVKAKQF